MNKTPEMFRELVDGIPIREGICSLPYTVVCQMDQNERIKFISLPSKIYWWVKWEIMPFDQAILRCDKILKVPHMDWMNFNFRPIQL